MIGDTLTKSNLQSIIDAMSKIAEIDRSQYFKDYLQEVQERLEVAISAEEIKAISRDK